MIDTSIETTTRGDIIITFHGPGAPKYTAVWSDLREHWKINTPYMQVTFFKKADGDVGSRVYPKHELTGSERSEALIVINTFEMEVAEYLRNHSNSMPSALPRVVKGDDIRGRNYYPRA